MSMLWRGFPQLPLHLHPEPHSDSFINFWLDKIGGVCPSSQRLWLTRGGRISGMPACNQPLEQGRRDQVMTLRLYIDNRRDDAEPGGFQAADDRTGMSRPLPR